MYRPEQRQEIAMISFRGHTIFKCVLATWLVTLLLITVGSDGQLDSESLFYMRLRPRLGHFPDVDGYLNIFENYFNSAIRLNDKQLLNVDINDWRNVRPTGELCVDFLQSFQIKRYKLSKPQGIIALDACLGWLFDESDEKTEDANRFTVATKMEAQKLAKDRKLATIYESTAFKGDKVPKKTKDEVYEYLIKLLKVYADNPRSGCHGLWLETYTDFMEDVYLGDCDKDDDCLYFGYEGAAEDSYLNLIAESTKQSSITCYGVMQKQVKRIMRQAYEAEMAVSAKLSTKIKSATSKVEKQSEAMMWGKDMIKILQLVSGTDADSPISLAKVVQDLNKLRINHEETVDRFTAAVGKYAIQNVNLKDSANDPEGRARFGKAVTKLCKAYINPQLFLSQTGGSSLWQDPSENKNPFEFYNIVYGLIRLTNHLSLYGISKDKFEEDVLKNKWESLYLTTFACQLISITWGELDYDTNEEAYAVSFRSIDGEDLIEDWPLHVMLTKINDDTASGFTVAEQQADQGPSPQQQQPQTPAPQVHSQSHAHTLQTQPQPPQSFNANPSGKEHHRLFPSFKFNLFSKSKAAPKVMSVNKLDAAPKVDQVPKLETAPQPEAAPKQKAPVMSLESIEMFRDLHGRYPKLPPNIHEIYPSLPKNLDGVYPKNLGGKKLKPQPKAGPKPKLEPSAPKSSATVDFGYKLHNGQNFGFGGDSFNNFAPKPEPKAPMQRMNLVFK